MMDAFVISRLAFLMAVGLASYAGSAILGGLFVKQPERLRVALWWLLAIILALSCALVNGSWPFPPRESQHWIGYVLLFAALLRSIAFPSYLPPIRGCDLVSFTSKLDIHMTT